MLDELYVSAERFLSEGQVVQDEARPEAVRQRIRELWGEGADRPFLEHYLRALPPRYLYANEPDAIVRHARIALVAQKQSATITALGTLEPYVELCVIAEDRPGLLALITATFAHAKLKVLGAQIYSWTGPDGVGRSLDLFWVRSGQDSGIVLKAVPRLEQKLRELLAGKFDPVQLVMGPRGQAPLSSRPTPPVATKVNVDNRCASNHTVIEVITRDRYGLLFRLANALHLAGVSIDLAKVNTEGERVADVFYVVDGPAGGKITNPDRVEQIRQLIFATIARMETEK